MKIYTTYMENKIKKNVLFKNLDKKKSDKGQINI